MDLRHSSRLMCVSQRLYPSFKPIVVDLRFILVQHYLCLQTQNSEETNRSVSLAHSPCVWWCLRLLCCCPAVAGVLCMIMHCPGSAGYCCCLRRIGAGLCSKATAQASPTQADVRLMSGCRLMISGPGLCMHMGLCPDPAWACAHLASWPQAQPAAVANASRDGRDLGPAAASTQAGSECKAVRAPTARPVAAPARTRVVAVGWSLRRSCL